MTANYTDLRDWFTNMIFAGKTLEQINKMPKSTLDKLDVEYDKLIRLITQRETAASKIGYIEGYEQAKAGYGSLYNNNLAELKTLTKPEESGE